MKILVTGASGFVGGHLCERLVSEGHEVYGLIRSPKGSDYLFHVIQGDLSEESIQKWISKLPEDLEACIHTAGIVHSFDKEIFDLVNFKGTVDLELALKNKFSHFHFIFTSSLAAVGPSTLAKPHNEETPLNPPSLYGQSKKKAEIYLKDNLSKNWKLTIVRPPMVIGPKDPAVLDIFKMVKSRLILGTGLQGMKKLYSFVCVHDLVELLVKCLEENPQRIRTYFPAYPKLATYQEIVQAIKDQMKVTTLTLPVPMLIITALAHFVALIKKVIPLDVRLTPDKIHELAPQCWTVDSSLSISELGMNYQWGLSKTIELTYHDYKNRNWI